MRYYNVIRKTNKYKTKQTNRKKYLKERKKTQHEYTFYRSDLHIIFIRDAGN